MSIKKGLIIFLLILSLHLVFLLLISFPYIYNDISCAGLAKNVSDAITEKSGMELIEIHKRIGNTSGTGDHSDLYVVALVKTELEADALENYFNGENDIKIYTDPEDCTDCMDLFQIQFSYTPKNENCYIVEFVKYTPFSWLDLRGS